jgi:hypothetical protein
LPLNNARDTDFISIATLPDGQIAVGTANVGEVFVASASAQRGYCESVIHDAKGEARWGRARWIANAPAGTALRVETRTGNVAEPDGTWSAWEPARMDSAGEGAIVSPGARFLQYRVALEGNGVSPSLREISFSYIARNQPPRVTLQSPTGGERWSGAQTLRWNAQDPDGDAVTYEVFYSADNGAAWKPLPAGKPAETAASAATPTGAQGKESVEDLQKRLDRTNMPATMKAMLLERARQRAAGGLEEGAPSKETSRALDTALLPDGLYLFKIVASDGGVNPGEALKAQTITEPILICNALPQVAISAPVIAPDKTIALSGRVTQRRVGVIAVQYRVDEGDWLPALPQDGLFDSSEEAYAILTSRLASGKHVLEVLAFNAAGGKSSAKVTVDIP